MTSTIRASLLLLLLATTALAATDTRKTFAYQGGSFVNVDKGNWEERHKVGSDAFFETDRTKDYVELRRKEERLVRVRLYADRAEWIGPDTEGQWTKLYSGKWK